MKTSDFLFDLPEELIANAPVEGSRDSSRLMILRKEHQIIEQHQFSDILDILNPGDVLVMNDTKVLPARLFGRKDTGGAVELLLLRSIGGDAVRWEAMTKGKRLKEGSTLELEGGIKTTLEERASDQTWIVRFDCEQGEFSALVDAHGHTPVPPYMKDMQLSEEDLREKYQTVYARDEGSAAAPTAGLHFTPELLQALEHKGVQLEYITLHVGLGTFLPVKVEDTKNHTMHAEFAMVSEDVAQRINVARKEGRKVIAVGTTTTRTLESFMENGELQSGSKWTDIFITPGYEFQCISGLITNFHLPGSTLIMLVSALAGREFVLEAYKKAVADGYRFYSFGDAMLIL